MPQRPHARAHVRGTCYPAVVPNTCLQTHVSEYRSGVPGRCPAAGDAARKLPQVNLVWVRVWGRCVDGAEWQEMKKIRAERGPWSGFATTAVRNAILVDHGRPRKQIATRGAGSRRKRNLRQRGAGVRRQVYQRQTAPVSSSPTGRCHAAPIRLPASNSWSSYSSPKPGPVGSGIKPCSSSCRISGLVIGRVQGFP